MFINYSWSGAIIEKKTLFSIKICVIQDGCFYDKSYATAQSVSGIARGKKTIMLYFVQY